MATGKILLPAIVGTSAMTVFSYFVSSAKDKNFREPRILSQLVERLPKGYSKTPADITGWAAHYAVGILFVAFYHELWKETNLKPSIAAGATLGALSGVLGVVAWKKIFDIHPNPPAKKLKNYFGHLIIAHVVFGIFSAVTYKTFTDKKHQSA